MRIVATLLLIASSGFSQNKISGVTTLKGTNQLQAPSQYTSVWAFSPPGTGNDNSTFRTAVMPLPVIDGVSLIESWGSIEQTAPTQTPCGVTAPDQCQPDRAVPGWYHRYTWATYDSSTSPGIYQWFDLFGGIRKKVNLLVVGALGGVTNGATPAYVTGSAWTSLFAGSYARQDVVNYALYSCSPWTGTKTGAGVSITMSRGASGVVAVTWSGQPYATTDTIYGHGFVPPDYAPSAGTPVLLPGGAGFSYQSQCSSSCSTTPTTYGSLISAAESHPVPYEYPYKNALKAFWAAVASHYGPSFTYYSQLNYFRFGGSVGSEWYPYCTTNLAALSSPYGYVKSVTDADHVGWLDYYKEMALYLQPLSPPFKVLMSINSAETPTDYTYGNSEAGYAVAAASGFGVFDGFGSQGLSALDHYNCTSTNGCDTFPPATLNSASNWHPMFLLYKKLGAPLELQQQAISYPGDTTCSTMCGTGDGHYSGDLPTFLYPFATDAGLTDVEIYWRDLELAYDSQTYCRLNTPINGLCNPTFSVTVAGQITATQQSIFFQAVGQSSGGTYCSINGVGQGNYQGNATGSCSYAYAINSAHGFH